jgi:hypothetical protein
LLHCRLARSTSSRPGWCLPTSRPSSTRRPI